MIRIFFSNKAEKLGERLAMEVSSSASDVFRPEVVLIQARGMERWLSMIIAEKNGICANFDFCFPKKMLSGIIHEENGLAPEKSPYDSQNLKLIIFRILASLDDQEKNFGSEFDIVRNFLKSDRYGLKRFQLSGQIASLYEKYLLCRPEMILSWDKEADNSWQSILWRKITSESDFPHPILLMDDFIKKAEHGSINKEKLPERISIFGISSLPPIYISILEALSKYSDVRLYCLNPCMEYWGNLPKITHRKAAVRKEKNLDDMHLEETNDLLESMGESLSDFLETLYSLANIEEHQLFDMEESGKDHNLLSFIQSSMLSMQNSSSENCSKHEKKANDDSISIHNCHGPMREAEVLFDRLMDMLTTDESLEPGDIIVMMPDITDYGPCIEAVFGSGGGSGARIPYTMADTIAGSDKKAADCFLSILRLRGSRMSLSEVLDILENDSVAARFAMTVEDLSIIKKWLLEARVSGEMDENHRKAMGLPGFRENSWAHAIDRLLLGMAMDNPDTDSFYGISPLPGIMTSNFGTLSRFIEFWSDLSAAVSDLEIKREVIEWVPIVSRLIDNFLDDSESGAAKRMIRSALFRLKDLAELTGLSQKTDINIITEYLSEELEKNAAASGFLTGGVTFCSMLPMRSIPFKVVCLMGMNNSSFPRNDANPGFDLTLEKPRPGDPSIRRDDRQLFLDMLVSAREKLYISYSGQSPRDNAEIPPSVLVSELIDYLDESLIPEGSGGIPTYKVSEEIIIKHPMHGFSPSCFKKTPKSKIFGFNREYFEAASAIISEKKENKPFWENEIKPDLHEDLSVSLNELKKFWRNPCEYAVKRVIGANIDKMDANPEISTSSIYSGLERHRVFAQNIKLRSLIDERKDRHQKLISQGLLQHGPLGDITHAIYEAEADSVEGLMDPKLCLKEKIRIDLTIEKFTIHGSVDAYREREYESPRLLFVRYGSINSAQAIVSAWIDFLACRAAGVNEDSFMIAGFMDSKKERSAASMESASISRDEAEAHLLSLLENYYNGLLKPLLFLPGPSMEFAKGILKGKDDKALYRDLENKLSGHQSTIKAGYYENLCFGENVADLFFNSDDFRKTAISVFEPIIKAMDLA